MATIIPNQDFKHDREQYTKGEEYDVAPELAYYFKMCGWVGERAETGKEQTLEIRDGQIGHSSEVN